MMVIGGGWSWFLVGGDGCGYLAVVIVGRRWLSVVGGVGRFVGGWRWLAVVGSGWR